MESEERFITRHMSPTRFDYAPLGTMYKVKGSVDTFHIQVSKEDDKAEWVTIETILAKIFAHKFNDEAFIKEIVRLYFIEDKSLNNFCDILLNDTK